MMAGKRGLRHSPLELFDILLCQVLDRPPLLSPSGGRFRFRIVQERKRLCRRAPRRLELLAQRRQELTAIRLLLLRMNA